MSGPYDGSMRLHPLVPFGLPLIVLLSIFVAETQQALAAKDNGWLQKRFDGSKGKFTICITDDGVYTKNESAGYVILQGPKQPVTIYSDVRRNYFPLSERNDGGLKQTSGMA